MKLMALTVLVVVGLGVMPALTPVLLVTGGWPADLAVLIGLMGQVLFVAAVSEVAA